MTEKTPWQQRWLLLILALLSVGLTCSLGLWQLGRAAEKTSLQQARTQQAEKTSAEWPKPESRL
jgi:surfeit locus 1 family protein